MNRKFFLLVIVLLVFSINAFSQNATGDVQVRLSLADGKTVFRTGEPIRLTLTFTANGVKYNLLINENEIVSSSDEIILTPNEGVFDWAAKYTSGRNIVNHSFMYTELSDQPINVKVVLNDKFRFDKIGKYSVRIKTKRVETGEFREENRERISLTTNEVGFEIAAMSEAEEQAEVKRLSPLLDVKRDLNEEIRISEQLSFLTGDASTREKVKRYLDSRGHSGNYHQNIYYGLFIARNRALAVKLLEETLRDTNREANFQLLNMLVQLRLMLESRAVETEPSAPEIVGQNGRRADEIRQSYIKELIESLPKRAGKNLTSTAIAILQTLPKDKTAPADISAKVREILLKKFDELDIFDREYLLSAYWENLRDASLAPSMERMLTDKNLPQMYRLNVHATALKRLIELDQAKARPLVVAEIRNPNSYVGVDVLGALDDKFLPETDDALLEQIRNLAPLKNGARDNTLLRLKSLLAARYATAKIYDGALESYKNHGDKWEANTKGSLLGYFARLNDKEAVSLVEEALAKIGNGSEFSLLTSLTEVNFPKGVADFFRKRLAANNETTGTAAYLISKYGDESDKSLIRARYNRWLKEWSGRTAELDAADYSSPTGVQKMLQVSLLEALIRAEAWKLPAAEIEQLKQSCLTAICRQTFQIK